MKRELIHRGRRFLPLVPHAAPNNREASRREADKAKLARRQQRLREEALARQRLADRRERRRQEEVKEEQARQVHLLLHPRLSYSVLAAAIISPPASLYLPNPFTPAPLPALLPGLAEPRDARAFASCWETGYLQHWLPLPEPRPAGWQYGAC